MTVFLDHGPSVEEDGNDPAPYAATFAKGEHKVIKPGDTIPVKGLEVTVMVAAGEHIARKGEPNPFCAGIGPKEGEEGENPQSAGVLIQFGKFRFFRSWRHYVEQGTGAAVPRESYRQGRCCDYDAPRHNRVFESDLRDGASGDRYEQRSPQGRRPRGLEGVLKASPGLEDLWQIHFAVAGGKDANVPDTLIANVDEQCQGKYLKISAESDGSFSVYNSRNKYAKTYAAK